MHRNVLNLPAYKMLGSTESEHDYYIKAETSVPLTIRSNCKRIEVYMEISSNLKYTRFYADPKKINRLKYAVNSLCMRDDYLRMLKSHLFF